MRRPRKAAQQLRHAIELLPTETREAMLRGIDGNTIIVGAYTDRDGGVCPMLAAHRNGGRTNFSSFARAWDRFTGAGGRSRRATERETRILRAYLDLSLLRDEVHDRSVTELADEIRADRRRIKEREAHEGPREPLPAEAELPPETGERDRSGELRSRRGWAWMRPTRRYDVFREVLARAEEEVADERARLAEGELERI